MTYKNPISFSFLTIKARFILRCSLFSQILFAKIVIITELSLNLHQN